MLRKQKRILRNRLHKNNKGVTLIEVIAVIAVLGVVMAAVTGFMISGTKMSARVSDTATSSIREQTAVEFINRRLWEAASVEFADDSKEITIDNTTYKLKIELVTAQGGTALIYTDGNVDQDGNFAEDSRVVYCLGENDPVELYIGTLYFDINGLENGTVTYYLNGEEHVVHLRVAPQS